MRHVYFTDPHVSRHPPECRAETYPLEILAKFHECARIAQKIGASAIGCAGDWFHRKGKVTFTEANDVLHVLNHWRAALGLEVIGILGNHDIAGHSLDHLDQRAVGSMVHSGVLRLLDHSPYEDKDDEGHVFVTGTSYFHGCDHDNDARLRMYGYPREKVPEGAVHIHLAHGTLIPKGTFFEDYTLMPGLVDLLKENNACPDVIICGHLHYPEGIKTYGDCTIIRPGSLGRVSSDDFDRLPNALVLAIKGRKVVAKLIPIGKEVNVGGETQEGKTPADVSAERIREFVRVLREEADVLSLVDHSSLITEINSRMGFSDSIRDIALKAVERRQ